MRAVVFDFDGVLVDSEPLHYRALRDALQPEGIAVSQDEYVQVYLAYDDRECIRVALERHGQAYDLERVDAVARRKGRLFDMHLADVPFFPGARELVTSLAAEFPLAIASGALHAEIEAILSAGNLRAPFTTVVAADDVERTKPDPMPYLEAARRLRVLAPDLEPRECVAIEDSPAGIASARAAGMTVVGVAHSYPAAKLRGLAHHVVESLGELSVTSLRAMAR
jgi:beta-phosphoglucomutase